MHKCVRVCPFMYPHSLQLEPPSHFENAGRLVGDEGAEVLAKHLNKHRSLKVLNLADSGIGIKGAVKLAQALNTNTSLTELNLLSEWPLAEEETRRAYDARSKMHMGTVSRVGAEVGPEIALA
jgi:hypothetical protein